MSRFDGASAHDLLTRWAAWASDDEAVWAEEWADLSDRAVSLACNDPFIAALVQAHLLGTLGPTGLRSTSLYDDCRDEATTSDDAHALRRAITTITDRTWQGRDLDAEGVRTRLDLEVALAWSAFVKGDGFAVRVAGVGGASAWRLIDPARIRNPGGKPNGNGMRDGFKLENGRVTGIWVARTTSATAGVWGQDDKPQWVPWYAPDGTPNVIHRVGYRLPGMLRGVSRLAPMIILSRQLHGVMESHVAAKRLQAVHALVVEANSPEEWKAAMANGSALGSPKWDVRGPLNVWIKPQGGGEVQFTDTKFNGADLKDLLVISYKVQCAAVAVPVDVVLCQMGEASLSSARAGLDQFDRTCQAEQEHHINEATAVIDRVAMSDAVLDGALTLPADSDWRDITVAKYSRPPKYSTDRLKDANTIAALRAAGVSGTTAYAMFGLVYEDERELCAIEAQFDKAQATPSEPGQPATPATAPAQTAAPATEDQPAARASWWRRAIARVSGHRIAA